MVVKIKFNNSAFKEIRTSPKVLAELQKRAERIAQGCGEDYVAESSITGGRGRARAAVFPTTGKAIRDNATNNTILKNLDKGRG